MSRKKKPILFITLPILALGIIGWILWLLNFHLLFFGKSTISTNLCEENPYISFLKGKVSEPLQNLESESCFQKIFSRSGFTNIKVPKTAEHMTVTVEAEPPNDKLMFSYLHAPEKVRFQVSSHPALEQLPWKNASRDYFNVFYRENMELPETLESLVNENAQKTAVYYTPDIIKNFLKENFEVPLPLRGDHTLSVFVTDNGLLDIKINYRKASETGRFGAHLSLHGFKKQYTQTPVEEENTIDIYEKGIEPGLYTLTLDHEGDIIVSTIRSKNVFFINDKITLFDPQQEITLRTDSEDFALNTVHTTGEQTMRIDSKPIYLKKNTKYIHDTNSTKTKEIHASRADFEMRTYGNTIYTKEIPLPLVYLAKNYIDSEEVFLTKDSGTDEPLANYDYVIFHGTRDFFIRKNPEYKLSKENKFTIELPIESILIDEDRNFSLHLFTPEPAGIGEEFLIHNIEVQFSNKKRTE